jgi:phage-related protein
MSAPLPLQSYIDQTSQNDTTYKILEVKYGNGYSVRAGDGYNNNQASWNVSWGSITSTDLGTLVSAFDAARGVDYFTWQAPGDAASKKWIVKKHSRSALAGSIYRVSATLDQCFDL